MQLRTEIRTSGDSRQRHKPTSPAAGSRRPRYDSADGCHAQAAGNSEHEYSYAPGWSEWLAQRRGAVVVPHFCIREIIKQKAAPSPFNPKRFPLLSASVVV